jgi:hypothetical protein
LVVVFSMEFLFFSFINCLAIRSLLNQIIYSVMRFVRSTIF